MLNDQLLITLAVVAGVLALVGIIALANYYQEKKRTEAFRNLAGELNFEFLPARPAVLEYFEQHTGLNVEGGGDLLIYSTYKRLDPEKIRAFMAEGFEILNLFQPPAAEG